MLVDGGVEGEERREDWRKGAFGGDWGWQREKEEQGRAERGRCVMEG